jgi:hypothetical protein
VVNGVGVLEVVLDVLRRLGSNDKRIYYHVKGMEAYQAQIRDVVELKRRFNINC